MKFKNILCFFNRHRWKSAKSIRGSGADHQDFECWVGYICDRCNDRKIEKTRSYIGTVGEINQTAYDWLREKQIPVNPKIKIISRKEE